jgi:hypothetical protein
MAAFEPLVNLLVLLSALSVAAKRLAAVRRAVDELAAARFVDAWTTAPASFSVSGERWAHALGLKEMPQWVYWHPVYAVVADLDGWWREPTTGKLSPYMLSSQLRDLFERRRAALEQSGIRLPLDAHPGEDLVPKAGEALDALREKITTWA